MLVSGHRGGRQESRHDAQGVLPTDLEAGGALSGMSADNGSATTVRSSKADRHGWSGSDYASSSSNDIHDYIGAFHPGLPAFPSPSTSDTKRITRKIATTISYVENSLNRPKATSRPRGVSPSRLLYADRRHVSYFPEGHGSHSGMQHELGRHSLRPVQVLQAMVPAPSPISSATTSPFGGADEDSATTGPRNRDMEYSASETDILSDTEEKLERLAEQYTRLRRKRTETREIFRWLRHERTQLQDIRERKASAGRSFMAAAQAILPENPGLDSLFKQMQDSHLMYDQAEQRLEDLIDQLEDGQLELDLEERKFYSEAARPDSALSCSSDSSTDDTASRFTLKGISADRPEDIHPLFEELLEAFRDLQLARESWADLKMKKRALEAKLTPEDSINLGQNLGGLERTKAFLARNYKVMTEEEVEFLQEYDDLEKQAISDTQLYSAKAKALQKECSERGCMPKHSPFREEGFGFDPFFRDDIRLGDFPPRCDITKPRTLAHDVFPILLSNPTHLLEAFPQTPQQSLRMATSLPPSLPARQKFINDAAREYNIYSLIRDADPEDKSDYINRWLLHKLRLSALEAEVLYSTFRVQLKIRDITRWQQDVLDFWTFDKAANLPMHQFQAVSETPKSALVDSKTDLPKPTRHRSESSQLDFIGSWDVDKAWP